MSELQKDRWGLNAEGVAASSLPLYTSRVDSGFSSRQIVFIGGLGAGGRIRSVATSVLLLCWSSWGSDLGYFLGVFVCRQRVRGKKKKRGKKNRELGYHILFTDSSAFVTLPVSAGGFHLLWSAIKWQGILLCVNLTRTLPVFTDI